MLLATAQNGLLEIVATTKKDATALYKALKGGEIPEPDLAAQWRAACVSLPARMALTTAGTIATVTAAIKDAYPDEAELLEKLAREPKESGAEPIIPAPKPEPTGREAALDERNEAK